LLKEVSVRLKNNSLNDVFKFGDARKILTYLPTPQLLTTWSRVFLEKLTGFWLVQKFSAFYGTQRFSTAFTQVSATCLYHEPAQSSPYPHIPLPEDPSYLPIYAWVSQVVSFPQVSPSKPCIPLSTPPYALYAPPISFFMILSSEQNWVGSTGH
jgi:hypothetical protein